MNDGHAARAAAFVADDERVHWHDRALWHVRARRDAAVASVPEWEALRERARRIKAHTLSRLADYLEEFEARAEESGIRVHWARDAEEHNRIVYDLLQSRGVTRVVKSKSMLTEECGLNPHLEARGVEVTDTDLGEWIVQMRREPPSHIVLPAIHLKKEEIGTLFHERIGTDEGSSDPAYLVAAARDHLRRKFLGAQAAITGVNFAVAETGAIVVCTNEGNADLGTSLAPLHIACMGVEKVIPRWADLGVFLRLLARSATGQHATAYASHFQGPRRGSEMHVVIVDNGRSELAGDAELGPALACIRCGACFNTCPVYRRSGGHSYSTTVAGPIGSVLAPSRDASTHRSLPLACTLCGSCTDVCPVRVPLHDQLRAWRGRLGERRLLAPAKRHGMTAARFVLSRPAAFAALSRLGRWLVRRLPEPLRRRLAPAWTAGRDLPEVPRESFRERWVRERRP